MLNKIILWLVMLFLFGITAFMFIGLLQKPIFKATIGKEVPYSQEQVWERLTNVEAFPTWRKSITEATLVGKNEDGFAIWEEKSPPNTKIVFEFTEMDPYDKLTMKTKETNAGIKGIWNYEIEYRDKNTSYVRLTENSKTNNVFTRAFFYFAGRDKFIQEELELLGN